MSSVQKNQSARSTRAGKADLHMHTAFSDGAHTPEALIQKAAKAGLSIISITDHDSVDGLAEGIAIGKRLGVEVVPGIELSAVLSGREIHILGYFIDLTNAEFRDALRHFREDRRRRAERIVARLNELKIPITIESVAAIAGEGAMGRPHIARALVEGGFVETYYGAFSRYIGDNGPAYERKKEVSATDIISMINRAGGLSVIAHPGRSTSESEITTLIRAGIDGIEVTHPSHSPELVNYYRGIVNQYYLIESGGSDYHGGLKNDEYSFGNVHVPAETVDAMENRLPSK